MGLELQPLLIGLLLLSVGILGIVAPPRYNPFRLRRRYSGALDTAGKSRVAKTFGGLFVFFGLTGLIASCPHESAEDLAAPHVRSPSSSALPGPSPTADD